MIRKVFAQRPFSNAAAEYMRRHDESRLGFNATSKPRGVCDHAVFLNRKTRFPVRSHDESNPRPPGEGKGRGDYGEMKAIVTTFRLSVWPQSVVFGIDQGRGRKAVHLGKIE